MISIQWTNNKFIESSEAEKIKDKFLEQISSLSSRQKFHLHLEGKVPAQTGPKYGWFGFPFSKCSNLKWYNTGFELQPDIVYRRNGLNERIFNE